MGEEFLSRLADFETCASDGSRMISERKIWNRNQRVNKLPSEILSHIFAIGEDEERRERQQQTSKEPRYVRLQELASHVCSHWRHVAINDFTLWTHIHITSPPHRMASLYLDRAGPTALLGIDLDLGRGYWKKVGVRREDHTKQASHIPQILDFLVAHGAGVDRWKSMHVSIAQYQALTPLISFLNTQLAPALRYLSWERELFPRGLHRVDESGLDSDEFLPLSRSSLPNLCCLRTSAIPLYFLFRPPSTGLAGLTELSFELGYPMYSLLKLGDFLSANPQLETLEIDTGYSLHLPPQSTVPRVCLPSLRSFKIHNMFHLPWVLDFLDMVDAPTLQKLVLDCGPKIISTTGGGPIATFIAFGKLPRNGSEVDSSECSDSRPFYPLLRELDVSKFSCPQLELTALFLAFPLVTHLRICGKQAVCLNLVSRVLPNLVSLKFSRLVYPGLADVLHCRAITGLPVQVVQVHKEFGLHVEEELPGPTKVELYHDRHFQHDYYFGGAEEIEDESNSNEDWSE